MWCGGISTHCEDDKHTKSDCGRHPHCNSSEPASPVSPHAGIVAPARSKDQCRGALNSQLGARLIMDTLASLVETATWATASLDRNVNRPNSSAILPRGLLSVSAASTSAFAENRALACVPRLSKRASTSSRRRISWGRDAPDGTAIGNGLRL